MEEEMFAVVSALRKKAEFTMQSLVKLSGGEHVKLGFLKKCSFPQTGGSPLPGPTGHGGVGI